MFSGDRVLMKPTIGILGRCAAEKRDELASSHCLPRGSGQGIVAAQTCTGKDPNFMSALGQKRTYAVQLAMSAKGHKRTCAAQEVMSALSPKADTRHRSQKNDCSYRPQSFGKQVDV